MQQCICKHVRSIHTHRFKPFAYISETFIEMVILYAHGALINQLNLLWWVWIKRYATICIGKHVRSIHTHRFNSFSTISDTYIETVILYAHGALINQLNLLWWVWIKRYATICICKHVRSIHTHRFKPFATISETFIQMVILYAHVALINQLNLLWWV